MRSAPTPVRINWRIVFGAAVVLIVLFTFQNYTNPPGGRELTLARTFGLQVIQWGTWLLLTPLIIAVARRWRQHQRFTVGSLAAQLVISLAVSPLHSQIAGVLRWTLGWSVYPDLGDVLQASVLANPASNVLRYWLIASAYHAVAYHREVRARDLEAAKLEASLLQARLDTLQGRLHPHFLFNTLNSIAALIRQQPAAAEEMIGSLSDLLRASLSAEPAREVTLDRELALLRHYVSIQQMRFQDRLTVSIEAAPDVLGACVPHLVLQPLVENAIRHGIAPREAPGRVRVAAGRDGERLRLIVEDDGIGLPAVNGTAADSGFGLSGTRARLAHLYGAAATFDIRARTPGGTVATIELPYHTTPSPPAAEASR